MLAKLMQGGRLIFIGLIVILVAGLLATTSSLTRARAEVNEMAASTEAIVAAREAEIRFDERTTVNADWEERQKYCNAGGRGHAFTGPDDYGRFGFYHPCTWSIYISQPARGGGNFEAIFHPRQVVAGGGEVYALRFQILNQSYDNVISSRSGQVTAGRLTQSTFSNTINPGQITQYEISGMRFDGEMVPGVPGGSEVIFRIRDKTAIVRTDSGLFREDFNRLIETIVYTP